MRVVSRPIRIGMLIGGVAGVGLLIWVGIATAGGDLSQGLREPGLPVGVTTEDHQRFLLQGADEARSARPQDDGSQSDVNMTSYGAEWTPELEEEMLAAERLGLDAYLTRTGPNGEWHVDVAMSYDEATRVRYLEELESVRR
ncbi:MAG: hypothetical protein Q8M55_08040 [Actinomycetota bacterium]|nr:hypothetical protein [Actinomycetota bacterium]